MADDFLRRNAVRLLREHWNSPAALAQELYTILADEASGGMSTRTPVAQARAEQVAEQAVRGLPQPAPRPTAPAARVMPRPSPKPDLVGLMDQVATYAPTPIRATPSGISVQPGSVAAPVAMPAVPDYGPGQFPESYPDGPPPVVPVAPARPRRDAEVVPQSVPSTGVTGAGREGVRYSSPRRPHPDGLVLPAPAYVAFAVSPDATAYSYDPLGLPGAYSGLERAAGDYNPANGPIYREVPDDDPFARRYYDLRFYLPDWDSPRAVAGGGSSTLIGRVLTTGTSPVQVMLYPGGPNSGPDPSSSVPVNILQLAPGETVPANTWITGILQAGDGYYAQVPVWLSDDGSTSGGG